MNRRRLLASTLGTVATSLTHTRRAHALTPHPTPTLDAHIHLFDPTRPGGVPWPEPTDTIYRPALPDRIQQLASPLGVVGAIAIEASPDPADNHWLLAQLHAHPFLVGMVGNLAPGTPAFRADLARLHRSPLFLGIRYGNLWHRDLAQDMHRPGFLDDLRTLADARLVFESANPTPSLLTAILAVAQAVPSLRIVIDHLPNMALPSSPPERAACLETLRHLAASPNVFMKLSEILLHTPGTIQTSSLPCRERLDLLWDLFTPARILFGSDWPNSDHVASYAEVLAVARDFVRRREQAAAPAVFAANSRQVYRWHPRTPAQRTVHL